MMNQLCVPRSAVSLAGESGDEVAPEKGDKVTLTVEGTVDRAEGDSVYINPETANGQPVNTPQMKPDYNEGGGPAMMQTAGNGLRDEWAKKEVL